jgi:hypothetical protein
MKASRASIRPVPSWPTARRALAAAFMAGVVLLWGAAAGADTPASAAASPPAAGPPVPALPALSPGGSGSWLPALLALQQAELLAPDGAADDLFGCSVAVSGETAIVGARWDDTDRGAKAGSAYVFVRAGGSWSLQTHLTAEDGAVNDRFGTSVAVSGDIVAVGVPGYDHSGANDAGAAYVFVRSGASWSFQDKLLALDPHTEDYLGVTVALSGDTALIGARWDDTDRGTNAGSAYVFTRSGAAWNQQGRLTASDGAAEDYFGESVALSGDTAVVGAYWHDTIAGANAGAAYVFVRSGAVWTQQQQLTASDGAAGDALGTSVAVSGDTAVAGAPYDDLVVGGDAGSAYVFVRSGTVWTPQVKLTAADAGGGDGFGSSVAASGEAALIGAGGDDTAAGVNAGSGYVFSRAGSTWSQEAHLLAAPAAAGDYFGGAVALSGATAVIGAVDHDTAAGASAGAAYAFLLDGAAPVTTATVVPAPNAKGWNKSPVTVTLAAADALSGAAATSYRRQPATAWTPYTAPFRVTVDGVSTHEFFSRDAAGNEEAAQSVVARIDQRRPATKAYSATVEQGRKVGLRYRVNDALPGCGKAAVALRIYKGKKLKKTIKVPGTSVCNVKRTYPWRCALAKGTYTVKVSATDIAGNAQSRVGSARLTVK